MSGEYSIGFYPGCKIECVSAAYNYIHNGQIYEVIDVKHENDIVEIIIDDGTKMNYPTWCFKLVLEFTYFNPKIDYFKITKEIANI